MGCKFSQSKFPGASCVSPLVIIEFVIQNPLPQKRFKHLRVSAR
jgi:hypothetical protein